MGERAECYIPRRYNVLVWCFVSITLTYMMRSNLSIAILVMAKEYHWPLGLKGMYLSSFFWGYITTQLVGGLAARKLGPKRVMVFVIVVPSVLTMLIPVVAPRSEFLFVVCRVLTGVAAGATFPTMYLMLGGWTPFSEKATSLAIVFSGINIGTILIDTIGPVIMDHLGWPYVFYISGGAGFVWLFFWMLTVSSTPSEMKNIDPNETKYIMESSINEQAMLDEMGYQKINDGKAEADMSSMEALKILATKQSFWVIVSNALCLNWGQYIFLTWLPTYVHSELGFSVQMSGIIAITPNISNSLVGFISGHVCDKLLSRGVRLIVVRKMFFSLGCMLFIVMFILLGYANELHITPVQAAIILAIGSGGGGFLVPGYTANIYDIAPNHPSLVVGVSNTAGTIPGIIGVYSTGVLLQHGASWGVIWLITAGFYFVAMVSNYIFCDVKRIL